MTRAIWWIKRDFRLADNDALTMALSDNDQVLPLFVFEEDLIAQADYSPMHVRAWQQALEDLRRRIRSRGGDVFVRTGDALDTFESLKSNWDFTRIYAHEETGNDWTYQRDIAVQNWCKHTDVAFTELPQNGVIRGLQSREKRQSIIRSRLFEPKVLSAPETFKFPSDFENSDVVGSIPPLQNFFAPDELDGIDFGQLQTVSETSARADLSSWLSKRGLGYLGGISSPNTAFTHGSRLSVHLAWGTISLRTVFAAIKRKREKLSGDKSIQAIQWRKSLRGMESRLHWHDHFIQRLESAPQMEFRPLNPAYDVIQYENDPELLQAWRYGQTGFPIIDACMRCLCATGFLNFRMRAMVVSFACFGLHLDWKTIHPYLAQIFLDYEPGIHLSQLQMQAGIVGINTIRVYSPTKQIIDQDPDCRFIKQWIPELRNFTPAEITSYEKTALGEYPRPVVNFKARAKAMKDQIFAVRKSARGKTESAKVLKNHGSRRSRRKKKPPNQLELF
jgi:deoxyribodipyrimidine photo-lyase